MTTYYPFQPNQRGPVTYNNVTLDGNPYSLVVRWNLFGQRYYLYCYDQNQNLIFTVGIVESSNNFQLAQLAWNPASLWVRCQSVLPLPFGAQLGRVIRYTIVGCNPSGYNGVWDCMITGPNTFQYYSPNNPGGLTTAGQAGFLISLSAGYFSSTIVFRNSRFEISP